MNAIKIVENIKAEAKATAKKEGQDEYAYALGVVTAWLEMAIDAIDSRDAEYFYKRMSQYDHD